MSTTHTKNAQWIWPSAEKYPQYQKSYTSLMTRSDKYNYCVAEFKKTIETESRPVEAHLRVSGDTVFRLYLNGEVLGIGPACAGGDFLLGGPLPVHYANNYTFTPQTNSFDFFAQVRLSPLVYTDYSQGHGGFTLTLTLTFKDGSARTYETDETWLARINCKFTEPSTYDDRKEADEWSPANVVDNIWPLLDAPIPMLSATPVLPEDSRPIVFSPGETREVIVNFDKIYSAYVVMDIEAAGEYTLRARCVEIPGQDGDREKIDAAGSLTYRSIRMHSVGCIELKVWNNSDKPVTVRPSLVFTCYPANREGRFSCSDTELNKVYDVCKWTLQICRQTMHLDSPRHQELLACTGDYYIESLMEAMCFGDMRLSELDVLRTAIILTENKGRMFHTSYSLIWVQMLWEVYRFGANKAMVETCMPALHLLLDRFNGYIGDTGIIENAPNYMFVDWMVVDGYSLHHPPKALGQTCLNAFYHGALLTAEKLCKTAGDNARAKIYLERASALKASHNACLFDTQKGIYFDGLNSETKAGEFFPENSLKRYYSKHGNTLSVLYGLCDAETGRQIMEQVVNNEALTDVQLYFMHFVFEALKRVGLFEKYGFELLDRFKPMVKACDKGLQEGWHKPEETYSFDHSHAWGGTPAYQFPQQILGLEILEPGFKKIRLSPNLFALDWANISIPTPYGDLTCRLSKNSPPHIEIPEGIQLVR